jgi:hypothetical protein
MENKENYFKFIGKYLSDDDVATDVLLLGDNCRIIAPGEMYSLEFRHGRINLLVDDKDKVIAVFEG